MNQLTEIPLPSIDLAVIAAAELQLVHLPPAEKELMRTQYRTLQEAAARYMPTVPNITLRVPPKVLAAPLSAAQRTIVDDMATAGIAAICMDAQQAIAKIPLHECGEELVNLPEFSKAAGVVMTFSDHPYPNVSGPLFASKPQLFWVRRGFAERLVLLGKLVAEIGLTLHVEEAFRPLAVQAGMFRRRLTRTKREHLTWSAGQIAAESRTKTASSPRLASHMGGAAADVFLRDIRTGELLDIGHGYPDGGAVVHPTSPFVTAVQWSNRQTLQIAAALAGLTVYVGEGWHISFGDNLAAWQAGKDSAEYGPIQDFDTATGRITALFSDDTIDCLFDCID